MVVRTRLNTTHLGSKKLQHDSTGIHIVCSLLGVATKIYGNMRYGNGPP